MPLNLSVGDGDFVPYLKYNAKAGRFYVKPEGASEEIEITGPTLAFDMANIRTGWLFYAEGSGPEKMWDPSPAQMAPRPAGPKKFKRGFEVMVVGNMMLPGGKKLGLREFSSTAGNVIASILRMHSAYEIGLRDNPNNIPVFKCTGVKPITGAYGVNYEPQFELVQWVDRSRVPEFDEHSAPPAPNGNGNYELRSNGNFSTGGPRQSEDERSQQQPMRRTADPDNSDIPF